MQAALIPLLTSAGVGTATAGTIATGFSLASTGASVLSAVSSFTAGRQEQGAMNARAAQADLERKAEASQAAFETAERTEELNRVLASQAAIFGAGGVAAGSGSALTVAKETTRRGEREISRGQSLSAINQQQLTNQASQFRQAGKAAFTSGLLKGGNTLLTQFQRNKDRGTVEGGKK